MKRILFVTILAISVTYACQSPVDTAADEAAIREVFSRAVQMWNDADLEGALADVTDDFCGLYPDTTAVLGRDAIGESWQASFEGGAFGWHPEIETIEVSGDMAVTRYSFQADYQIPATDSVITRDGKGIWVFRRQADGSWKYAIEVSSWNTALN
jgi:uncharacterized protein (TIGR02246 family)